MNHDDINLEKFSFTHFYEVFTFGETPIGEASLIINVPTHWKGNEIARIDQMQGYFDGINFLCEEISSIYHSFSSLALDTKLFNKNDLITANTEENKYYINCSNKDVKCRAYSCQLGPFEPNFSIAELKVKINFHTSDINDGKKFIL